MIISHFSRSNVAIAVGTALLIIIPGTNRSFVVREIDITGMGIASADNELGIYQISVAGTGAGTALGTGGPYNNPNIAGFSGGTGTPVLTFSGSVFTGYATTPPTLGKLLHTCPVNANGNRYVWRPQGLDDMIEVAGGSLGIALAGIVGTSNVSARLRIGEVG